VRRFGADCRFVCLLPVVVVAAVGCGRSGQDRRQLSSAGSLDRFRQTNNATPQSPVRSVSRAVHRGAVGREPHVVVVGWNDTTARVVSVTDTKGNAY